MAATSSPSRRRSASGVDRPPASSSPATPGSTAVTAVQPRAARRVTQTAVVGGEVVQGTWIGMQAEQLVIQANQLRAFSRETVAQVEVGQRGRTGLYAGMAVGGLSGVAVASGMEDEDDLDDMWSGWAMRMVPIALGAGLGALIGHRFDRVRWSPVEW